MRENQEKITEPVKGEVARHAESGVKVPAFGLEGGSGERATTLLSSATAAATAAAAATVSESTVVQRTHTPSAAKDMAKGAFSPSFKQQQSSWRLRCDIDELVGEATSVGHQSSGTSLGRFGSEAKADVSKGDVVVTHDLPLRSSYSQANETLPWDRTTGEPAFTSYHRLVQGCVDYIWYTDLKSRRGMWHNLRDRTGEKSRTIPKASSNAPSRFASIACCGVDEMPNKRFLDKWANGLPSKHRASDHLPLVARFRWVLKM